MGDIYSVEAITDLFDEMSRTYGLVNMFSSLGFAYFWRKKCIAAAGISPSHLHICDLMSGSGECLQFIRKAASPQARISLIDISPNMCELASQTVLRHQASQVEILLHDALNLPFADLSIDVIVSTFGLKTFNPEQQARLMREITRVLKPGGRLSILEFSIPHQRFIRFFFMLYVRYYVPMLGWVFLGNPDNYRKLWMYTALFHSCSGISAMAADSLYLSYDRYCFGAATHVYGTKL